MAITVHSDIEPVIYLLFFQKKEPIGDDSNITDEMKNNLSNLTLDAMKVTCLKHAHSRARSC